MPIRLIGDTEKFPLYFEGATFYYRRIPADKNAAIIAKYTRRGELDGIAYTRAAAKYALADWKGVQDPDGTEVAFDADLIERLPLAALTKIAGSATASLDGTPVESPEQLSEIMGGYTGAED
jgi:hypothetical protein